ncbi:MAG: hypothetical protein U0470_13630 [Anaerolineae bacterium]
MIVFKTPAGARGRVADDTVYAVDRGAKKVDWTRTAARSTASTSRTARSRSTSPSPAAGST